MIMEYHQLLGNTPNQPTIFRTKICVEINDELGGVVRITLIVKLNLKCNC